VVAPEAAGTLFAACDTLSAQAYERSETSGALLLCARGHPCVEVLLEVTEPVPLRSTRAARKALEMSRGGVAPLSDGASIWGLGRVARPYDRAREDLFEIRFSGRSRWQFRHAGEVIFVVENRRPMIPEPLLGRERFEALVRDVLGERDEAHVARIWATVSSVVAAECGSTIVISAEASAEARRLAAQGTPIVPRELEPEVLQAATGIGGAFLIDTTGVCHAIGVILDGLATARGERSRGSRFNSAANYVRGRTGTLAVVISDDGSVDLFVGDAHTGGQRVTSPPGPRT
jgi:hypothetical protein